MTLKETLEAARADAQYRAGGAIENLATIADRLGLADAARQLEETRQLLASDTFNIVVIGRFKNGKSTLLNALIGGTTRPVTELGLGVGPMPVDTLPTTATLTKVVYADEPFVRRYRYDGACEEWTFARFLRDAVIQPDRDQNWQLFGDVRDFEVGFPAELCQAGVVLIDSPGTDEDRQRTEVTRQAVERADVAILVFQTRALAGDDERNFARKVKAEGTRTFTVINRIDGAKVDDRLRHFTWDRLITENGGPPYGPSVTDKTFTDNDIYFVDALSAARARWVNGSGPEPGMALFEARLADFLVTERHQAHLKKFVRTAEVRAAPIDQHVRQCQAACREDEAALQQRYLEIQPQLEAVPKKLQQLPPIFAEYRARAVRELTADFESFVARLRSGLRDEFAAVPLPSLQDRSRLERALNQFRQKQLLDEAGKACAELMADKFSGWAAGAGTLLKPITEQLAREVDDVIDQVEREFQEISFQLVGLDATATTEARLITMKERVAAGVVGLVLGGVGGGLGASVIGFRALVPAFVAQFATGFVLALLGLTAPVILIPAAILAGLAASIGLNINTFEKKTREAVVKQALAAIPAEATKGAAAIEQQVGAVFDQVEAEVMTAARAVVEEESRGIHRVAELNRQSQADKARELDLLDQISRDLAANLGALHAVDVTAQQVA